MQISGETIGEVKTVADMHQRKSEMAKHADAFIALPGNLYNNNIYLFFVVVFVWVIYVKFFYLFLLLLLRWIWNNGRIVRDDNLVSVRNP